MYPLIQARRRVLSIRWLILLAPLVGANAGCVRFSTTEGVDYHLILGFGLVRTKAATDSAIIATDSRSFGVVVSDRPGLKLGIGYASSTVVSVAEGSEDVRVEVSRQPFGPLVVDAPSARLKKYPASQTRPINNEQ